MPSAEEVFLHRRYWQRSILIPLWTQQILLQFCGVIFFWFAITIFWDGGPSHGSPVNGRGSRREQVILASFFLLYVSLLLATLGEILLFSASVLRPKGYLCSQALKTLASAGVWAVLILYPYVIKDPIYNRKQVAVCMEAVFAWLQIPMLSSLIHALLVWREEWRVNKEWREFEQQEHCEAQTLVNPSPAIQPQVVQTSERTPLLASRVLGSSGRKPSTYGRSYSQRGSSIV